MTVRFFAINTTTAGVDDVGTLTLIDGQLVADPPDSIALNGILDEPLITYDVEDNDRRVLIDAKTEPEQFLKAIWKVYHGTYFWAGKVED